MLTEDQINFLNRVCPYRWAEEDGVINVKSRLDITEMHLTEIPVQFGRVSGNFDCHKNQLTTLKGAPYIVNGYFDCDNNNLLSLEGGPKEVKGYYSCCYNKLTNLIGAPEICNDVFWCQENELTSLEGCPSLIKSDLHCRDNSDLYLLYGIGRVNGGVYYDHVNDLNEWIISRAHENIFSTYTDVAKWIKDNNRLKFLLHSSEEIRQHFSPRILHLVDSGFYNESKILDYKKFSRIC